MRHGSRSDCPSSPVGRHIGSHRYLERNCPGSYMVEKHTGRLTEADRIHRIGVITNVITYDLGIVHR